MTIGFIGRKLYLNNRYRSDSEQIIHWKIKMPASVYELLVSVENSRFFVFFTNSGHSKRHEYEIWNEG